MENTVVADHILRLSYAELARSRLDLAITVLLLQDSGRDVALAYDGLRRRRYKLDSRFVVELLETAGKRVQWAIVRSPAFWHLPAHLYRRYFFHFWRLRHRDRPWRWVLGRSLHPFLMENPRQGHLYAGPIWTTVRDRDESVALAGLSNVQFLGRALTPGQAETLIALTRHDSERGPAAISAIGGLYKDFGNLRPEVKALLLAPRTTATLRVPHPRDSGGQWSARHWCLTNMRKALGRARKGRVPRVVNAAPWRSPPRRERPTTAT